MLIKYYSWRRLGSNTCDFISYPLLAIETVVFERLRAQFFSAGNILATQKFNHKTIFWCCLG